MIWSNRKLVYGEWTIKYTTSLGDNKLVGVTLKSKKELVYMREAGRVVALVKVKLAEAIGSGVTTMELDRIADREIKVLGARSNFKGYLGYPASICVSINDEVVHGIPSNRVIKEGDVVSVDVGAEVSGLHGDSAFTVAVGFVGKEIQSLIDVTKESLRLGIDQVRIGGRVGDISFAIQSYAEKSGYGVVREYVGHGIGRAMHEDPQVPNYGVRDRGHRLIDGMAIAIEPMLNLGGWETVQLDDGWTVATADGSISAHFEDTVSISEGGIEVLTQL